MSQQLEGKVVLITGGSEGIGYGMAKGLAARGAKVVIASRNEDKGKSAEHSLNEANADSTLYVPMDITKAQDHDRVIEAAVERFGRLDAAINNAVWPGDFKLLADEPEESFDLMYATNVKGTWLGMKAQINQYLAQGAQKGDNYSILNISSGATRTPGPTMSLYNSSKRAVEGLTEAAAVEYSGRGIRTNTLLFGVFHTAKSDMLHKQMPKFLEMNMMKHKVGRLGDPEKDAGAAAAYLISDEATFVSGSVFHLDGGMCL